MRYRLPRGKFYGQPLLRKDIAGLTLTETFYSPELIIDEHCHQSAFFCLILKGTYTEVYENRIRECKPLSLFFHPANEVHSNRIHKGGSREFQIEFGPDWANRIPDSTVLDHAAEFNNDQLPLVAMRLYREFHLADDISNLAVEALMLELMVLTFRSRRKREVNGKPDWLLRTEKSIHEHFTERLSVNDLAGHVHVHPAHLSVEFRKYHRCSIGDYIRDLRIKRACQQLVNSNQSLSEMALDSGFYDQSHFSRTFKQVIGMTPAQYRRQAP
jgi:AraC family transcriptional regulator